MVSSNIPKVSIGRIVERPQSVENPTSTSLSASVKAYEPTVSMGRNCPLNRPRVAEYPVSSALPLSVTQVPSYKHTMSDARQYVQNPQWAPESRSLPEVTQMTSYQPLYQHQMTTSFEQQTSQVSGPVNSTANQFASRCLPSNSLRGDILATANSYGSPRISSQIYGNSAVVESLHPTLDSQRNVCDSPPLPADNLTFMPGQRTMCLPGRVNYDSMFLPRPEFPKFSGDPLQYRTFITNFETHVESRIKDPKMLFCLLTQHCVDAVRERIQHLEGKGEQCYNLAKQRLTKEYGSPWIVSDVCEQKLKKFSSIKSGDAKQIKQFAELLEKSYNILVDINNFGSLNSLDSLTVLVTKLPYELRRRWVEKAVHIENSTGILAKFEHFVHFVQNESDKLNSLFGLRNLSVKVNKPGFKVKASSYSVSSNKPTPKKDTKSFLKTGVCWFCNDTSHKLLECKTFLSKSVKDRTSFVKSRKLCLKCLSARHRTPECTKERTCNVEGCKGAYHHTLLHYPREIKQKETSLRDTSSETSSAEGSSEKASSYSILNQQPHSDSDVYLCVVPVFIRNGNKEYCTYAFLDQGSSHTFCDDHLIEVLQVDGSQSKISLQTLNGLTKDQPTKVCELVVSDLDKQSSFVLPSVHSVETIPVKPNALKGKSVAEMPHLRDISFRELRGAKVSLLIGADVPEIFCIKSFRKGPRGTPVAIETPLGWSLLGSSLSPSFSTNCNVNFIRKRDESVEQLVQDMWEADFQKGTGVLDVPNSSEDREALHKLTSSIKATDDGHYQLPLLWKQEKISLPNNLNMAKQRLSSLKARLSKDRTLKDKYTEVINSYLSKGYAKQVDCDAQNEQSKIAWYLPHHPVINPHKSKIRVVFDCAAKYRGISLNDQLVRGPDLMNSLIGVLIRFRKEHIVMAADVEQMFHQVKVNPEHTDALRFLWWPDGDLQREPLPHQMTVHIFGAKSSPCCANFSLRQTVVEFGHLYEPLISKIIQ